MWRAGTIALVSLAACGVFDPEPLPPHGEALVVVDTDLPVPMVVSRLRIDVFAEDGTWIAHRDDVRPDPRDWPASFSVFNDDPSRTKALRVRLRAYLDARTVPRRGSEELEGGGTPELEPDPSMTVERTLEVRLVHGVRGRVRVLLRGECIGKKDCDASSEPVTLEPTMARDVASVAGTFGVQPCTSASSEDRVCIPGGAFVLGDAFKRFSVGGGTQETATHPERIVRLSKFEMDRDEVSVARFRASLGAGFDAPHPVEPLEVDGRPTDLSQSCSWSSVPRGREDYPLSCVSWETATAFCRFEGGELPTEAQWEYAATAAGRTRKATYPWGDDAPTCERAVYGRAPFNPLCVSLGEGPAPLAEESRDVTPLGVKNLGGSLEEHLRDHVLSYDADCWTNAPVTDPVCIVDDDPADPLGHGSRGGSWASDDDDLAAVVRNALPSPKSQNALLGFRCVYPSP